MSTLVLPLWPALGEIHLAITLVLRCSCRAWGSPESGGQLGAGVMANSLCQHSSSPASCPPGRLPPVPQPHHRMPSHHRALHMLFPGPRCSSCLSLLPGSQATVSPACWLGHIPSPSQSSPASASVFRTRLWGAPAPLGSHPTVHPVPPGTCADYPGRGSPPGPQC